MRKAMLLVSAVATVALPAMPALAQQGAYAEGSDIIVTARQRDETLLEVPVAVNAIGGEELSRLSMTDTRDLAKLAPSLSIGSSMSGAGAVISLRGIGTSPSNSGFEQAVSVNIDGVQTGRARVVSLGLLDVAQVQVMKGPQALFFGKNSPAGVISITSANPTRELTGYAKAGYEFVADEAIVEGVVSGPLSDSFGARVAVRYRNMDGWLRNTAGQLTSSPFASPAHLPLAPNTSRPGEKEFMGRLTLSFEPAGSPFDATLKVAGLAHEDDGPAAGQQLFSCGAFQNPVVSYSGNPTIAVDPFGDCKFDNKYSRGGLPAGYADNWPLAKQYPYTKLNMVLASLQANYTTDDFHITAVSGLFHSDAKYFDGFDGTVYMAYDGAEHEKFTTLSQEFRLLSTYDSPVNFMLGAYYQNTKLDFTNGSLIAALPVDAATGKYHTWERSGDTNGNTYSVFGQLIWNILPTLELAGGVRYTHETKNSQMANQYVYPLLSGTVLAPQGKQFIDRYTDNNYSPEATLSYRPTSDFTAYVAYKTGYKSGGFGLGTSLIPGNITVASLHFGAEQIKGVEGGVKANLFDRRATVTSAVYSYKYSDLQVNSFDPATTSYRTTNAAAARIKGVEVDFTARATEWLNLNAGIAYSSARYLHYLAGCYSGQTAAMGCNVANSNGSFSQNMAGKPLARAPDWSGSAGFDVNLPLGDSLKFGLTGNTRYSDKYLALDSGNPDGTQKSFWLFDASARVGSIDERWEVALIGRNLGNKWYAGYAADKPGAPVTAGTPSQVMAAPNRGRQVLLQVSTRF